MMNLQHLTERLRNNQETSLRVVLTPRISKDALTNLIASVQANESVTQVELLSCGSFLQEATTSLWQSLLGAFLSLPNLESFQMRGCSTACHFNDAKCAIPSDAFCTITSRRLKFFSLSQLVLIGGPRNLQCALQEQTSLRDFQLICIGFLDDDDVKGVGEAATTLTTSDALAPILKTLSQLPTLENLEVSGTFTPLGVLEKDEVPLSLFQSKTLQRLSISDLIFPEDAMTSIVTDGLATNHVLKELAISGNVTSSVATKLGQVLKHNKTLEAIALRVDNFDDETCNEELISAIGASHLKVVSLCNFFGGPLSPTARNAFTKMLETNCTLEYLYVPRPYSDLVFWNNIRLYCGLNSCGRKRVDNKKYHDDDNDYAEEEKKDDTEELQWQSSSASEINRSFYLAANKTATAAASPSPLTLTPSASSPKPTITSLTTSTTSPGKRHQRLVEEARSSKRRKFPVVPTQGLSSMFIR